MASERANDSPSNPEIAGVLDRIADLLEIQRANPHRVRAYRTGAQTVRNASEPVASLARRTEDPALLELPGIGEGLASVIHEYVTSGQSQMLNSLEGQVSPASVMTQVPVIGKTLAQRVVDQLHISSLQELEQAAHDGRLEQVEGFGPKRVEAVRVSLAGMLSGAAQQHTARARVIPAAKDASKVEKAPTTRADQPDVGMVLDVDAEYRRKAEAGELKTIAPRRFNPRGEAWLPLLRTKRGDWNFTALYSNTARAHELGTNLDWVVIYFERDGNERQCTVVTANSGPLEGKRVVRGREAECRQHYGLA